MEQRYNFFVMVVYKLTKKLYLVVVFLVFFYSFSLLFRQESLTDDSLQHAL